MKKHKAAGIISGILYYGRGLYFFFISYVIGMFDGVILEFSYGLFNVFYVVLPIILLILPIVFRILWKKTFLKSLLYACVGILIYGLFLVMVRVGITNYFKTFSTEKWSNPDWHGLRYLMIDDLEQKYVLEGSSEEEILKLLGNNEMEGGLQNPERRNMVCYFIDFTFPKSSYYCFYFDENGIVTEINLIRN